MQADRRLQAGYWRALAEQDRRIARDLAAREPNVACFHAQQSAEKAVKAVLVAIADDVPRVHFVTTLLDEAVGAGIEVAQDVFEAARIVDRYYAPTRYPDALGGLDPTRMFVEADARDALVLVDRVLQFADAALADER